MRIPEISITFALFEFLVTTDLLHWTDYGTRFDEVGTVHQVDLSTELTPPLFIRVEAFGAAE